MKYSIVLVVILSITYNVQAPDCCKIENPGSCEHYNGNCPAGTARSCQGACLEEKKPPVVQEDATVGKSEPAAPETANQAQDQLPG